MALPVEQKIKMGVGIVVAVLLANASLSYRAVRNLVSNEQMVSHTHEVLSSLESILSTVKDAETGQRGFIITGIRDYLQPYDQALARIDGEVERLRVLTQDNPQQQERVPLLHQKIRERLQIMQVAVALAAQGDMAGARERVMRGEGKRAMDELRLLANSMAQAENELLVRRTEESRKSQRDSIVTFVVANAVAIVLLVAIATIVLIGMRERERSENLVNEQRVQLLAAEHAARRQAEETSRSKDEFLAVLSHELRTPLTAVFGWVQMLKGRQMDRVTTDKALAVIDRNLRLQTHLIDDLLNVSQIIIGKLKLELETVDVAETLKNTLEAVRPSAEEKQITLHFRPAAQPAFISADPQRLAQIIWNILANAVKFTPKGGTILTEIRKSETELIVMVSDTGEGIPAEFLPKVFDRFTQADASKTRLHGGLGLGLALVRQLMELHGGQVRAESAGAAKGSTFTLTFPLAGAAQLSLVPSPAGSPTRSDSSLQGVRVLLAEDEQDTRGLIAHVLGQFGANVIEAASAAEAIREFAAEPPDIVISDIAMPGADGYTFLDMIRAKTSQPPPAIALTAYTANADKERVLRAGFRAHLSKPVEPAKLVSTIVEVLGGG